MKRIAAILAMLPALAWAVPAPLPITVNSQSDTAPTIQLYRGSPRTVRVTFRDGTAAGDLSGTSTSAIWMTWAVSTTSGAYVASDPKIYNATNGQADFDFTAGDLNYAPGRYIYEVGSTSTVVRQGTLLLGGSPFTTGTNSPAWTTNINLAGYTFLNYPWALAGSVGGTSTNTVNGLGTVNVLGGMNIGVRLSGTNIIVDATGLEAQVDATNAINAAMVISSNSFVRTTDTRGMTNSGNIVGGKFIAIDNSAAGLAASAVGGANNTVAGNYSINGGGYGNAASGVQSINGGGYNNAASGNDSVNGGGDDNIASGFRSVNGGGNGNVASGQNSSIAGGSGNTASGFAATVPGGLLNTASTNYAFAAGRNAKAIHEGSFVWGDSNGSDISSTASNEVTFRASGGFRILSGALYADIRGATNIPLTADGATVSQTATGVHISVTGGTATNTINGLGTVQIIGGSNAPPVRTVGTNVVVDMPFAVTSVVNAASAPGGTISGGVLTIGTNDAVGAGGGGVAEYLYWRTAPTGLVDSAMAANSWITIDLKNQISDPYNVVNSNNTFAVTSGIYRMHFQSDNANSAAGANFACRVSVNGTQDLAAARVYIPELISLGANGWGNGYSASTIGGFADSLGNSPDAADWYFYTTNTITNLTVQAIYTTGAEEFVSPFVECWYTRMLP